jgi:hypothetical protein
MYDPKKIVKDYCSQIKHAWEYTFSTWEEEEKVHYGAQTYHEVIARWQGKPIRRIVDVEKSREEAQRKQEEEAASKAFVATTSTHSELVKEEEPTTNKKRRKKERVQKKKEDD